MARIFLFGNNIDTDVIAPGGYLHLPLESQKVHCFESIYPNFSKQVKRDDIIIAGENFGSGSSREQAPALLREIGIGGVFAKSFSRLFFRNAINVGLFVGTYNFDTLFSDCDEVTVSFEDEEIRSQNSVLHFTSPSGIPRDILMAGGMINFAKKVIQNGSVNRDKLTE
ncbi:MAG: 3-isopropylmalate dehydratase [Thermoplasmatales archaeon]|nr:3-isopropylmalate dehydratase [Thermoplasmatales archaeon]